MSIGAEQLDSFAALAAAIGLLRNGELSGSWFENPIGSRGPAIQQGLSTMIFDDQQREGLLTFVDEALGPPGKSVRDGEVWVPLFANPDPAVTVFAVIEERAGVVHIGAGVEHTAGIGAPSVTSRIHVPIFQLDRSGAPNPPTGGGLPDWLLLGRVCGRIELTVDVTISDAAPVPGQPHLGGVAITVGIPTNAVDDLHLALALRDVQLPGAISPSSFSLDASNVDQLGGEVLELITGLVRAQAAALDLNDSQLRGFAGVTGMLGLRDVAGLPAFPLADLLSDGVGTLVGWIEGVLADNTARDAWLAQVALLLGATPDPDNDAVTIDVGPLDLHLGVHVSAGTGGHPIFTPWVSLTYDVRGGVDLSLTAELFRADTATGSVTALPALDVSAVFGAQAGYSALLTGDPGIGSVRLGLGLSELRTPQFVFTLHDVTLGGRPHPMLDLSTPTAALDAGNDAIDGALTAALTALGEGGALVATLLGLDAPTGVVGTNATSLLADPFGELRRYWDRLTSPAANAAAQSVFGRLRRLLTGAALAPAAGVGTATQPWLIPIAGDSGLRIHRDDSRLMVAVVASVDTPALGDFTVTGTLGLDLVTIDLAAANVAFVTRGSGRLSLHRTDGTAVVLALGRAAIETQSIDVEARWTPTGGFGVVVAAPSMAVEISPPDGPAGLRGPSRVALTMPTLDDTGTLVFTPDWDAVEAALAGLLREIDSPAIDALIDLAGWDTRVNGRLSLAGLIADARAALSEWLADVVHDCDNVRLVLGPFVALLSGFRFTAPIGSGSDRSPFRCLVAGEPRAPGVAVWLDPGCPPTPLRIGLALDRLTGRDTPVEAGDIARLCTDAALTLPDVADLLVSRPGLADGLNTLVNRWHLTDGLVAAPAAIPVDVTAVIFYGFGYDELVALGAVGALAGDVFDPGPTTIVHLTTAEWAAADWPGATLVDLRGTAAPSPLPAAASGPFLVILPTTAAAAAARPDRGGVGEQAALVAALLAQRGGPVGLIGYGDAGAAAVRAGHDIAAVTAVATVGSPWSGLSIEALRTGLGGDALLFLDRITRPDAHLWSQPLLAGEATALERVRRVVGRSLGVAAGGDLPVALSEPRRSGVTYVAAFGALQADHLLSGMAALVADGLEHRYETAQAAASGDGHVAHTGLHAAVDLPVIDLNLTGLLIGAGARLEMLTLGRDAGGLMISTDRIVHVDVHLGVHDGWLIGGPGAASADFAVRWMSARVSIPLDGAAAGSTHFVLHEASAFGVFRERWVVALDDEPEGTAMLPEVRTLLGQVVARITTASTPLAEALGALGLFRDGGLDPAGLDRLLHDTALTIRQVLSNATSTVGLAAALQQLTGGVGNGTAVSWEISGATVSVDLANRSATVVLAVPGGDGRPEVAAAVSFGGGDTAVSLSLGTLDPDTGGVALVASAGLNPAGPGVRIDWLAPGAAAPRSIPLAPTAETAALEELATTVVPAVVAHAATGWLRSKMSESSAVALDGVLDTLGLLGMERDNGSRPMLLPIGLFTDPAGWLRHGAAAWRTDPVGSAITLADALAPLIAPGRGANPGWPIVPGLTIGYRGVRGRLELTAAVDLDTVIDGRAVSTGIVAGLSIGTTGAPQVVLDAGVALDGRGVRVSITPNLRVELTRPVPTPPIVLYPASGSLGSIVSGVGSMVIPTVVDALLTRRDDLAPSFVRDVARAVHELVAALDLLDPATGKTSGDKLVLFGDKPADWTVGRLPALAASGLSQLAAALDPAGTVVAVLPSPTGTSKLGFGAARAITILLESGAKPSITFAATVSIPDIGQVSIDQLRMSATGLQVAGAVGPFLLDLGGAVLRPMATFRAGVTSASFSRMIGVGFALDNGAARSVEVRWGLDAQLPTLSLSSIVRSATGEAAETGLQAGLDLLSIAISLSTGIALDALGPVISPRATAGLQGVVFTDFAASTDVDPQFFVDLLDPDALLDRVKRLAWNLASSNALTVTIDSMVTISLVGDDVGGGRKQLGVGVSLVPGKRFAFPTNGDLKVEMEVDASWVNPPEPPGLTIFVLKGTVINGEVDLDIDPSLSVAGFGLRFTKTSGPLLDLGGIAIDGIGVSLYGGVAQELSGGLRIMLEGLAFAPAAQGGTNPLANSIMNDAGSAGAANRPAFSPSVAIQKNPGSPLSFNVRAGQPPGPWWIIVQRQLGPLYVDRVGFDSADSNGTVSRITLLFDGSVSLFGLTAAVDQLSLSWIGRDVFDIQSWSVDLKGLAVSADMVGVSLAGGLLRTVDAGVISYVGMLMGRFGVYGLSVFGGYTDDHGTPSFFVFGAINGSIGGPPAFFLTGLGGGLGINRGLIIPDNLSQFGEYPFIKSLDPGATASSDPMGELRLLSEYFPPQTSNFWFAAGISFTSFALVDGVAVVAVSFGQGLEINLLGLARMVLPRPQAALVSIELALRARFSTVEGVFMIQAQLTDNSWLLYEEVRLTGGFAFAIWWKGPLKGQFVLTLGGYHPDFHREGYPEVPRLGLIWRVSDEIVIKGGSYFALTSEALMAGVDVEVSADFGWAWAKLSFGAHGIVYFDPFWFEVRAYVRISAGIDIETFLGDISLSISLGAQIRVWGPEFSGEATIEVGPCEFTVGFGSERAIEGETLDWAAFTAKYLEAGPGNAAKALSSITGHGSLPAATGGDTGAPSSDGSRERPFEVFAEFELSIVTTVPISSFDLPGGSAITVPINTSAGSPASLGISPMKVGALVSVLKVSLERLDELNQVWVPMPTSLGKLAINLRRATPMAGGSNYGTDAYPIGAWGLAMPSNLPIKPLPAGDVLFAGNRLTLLAEAETMSKGPEIDYYRVESGRRPLPLQASGGARGAMGIVADSVVTFIPDSVAASLAKAEVLMFSVRTDAWPDGLLATGARSRLEHAAFRGVRSAPPLFGSLFDGLDVANGNAAEADRGTGPAKRKPPIAREPFVTGYLSAGTGALVRDLATTVGNGRIARRKAPSLESVEGRLAHELPVRLNTMALPASAKRAGRTLIAPAAHLIPRTGTPGATASFVGGPVGNSHLAGLVTGLPHPAVKGEARPAFRSRTAAVRAEDPATTIRAGDVVVLQAPDALIDTATTAAARPRLRVKGAARVTVIGADGSALSDQLVRDGDAVLPTGYSIIAAQADALDPAGGDIDRDGFAGWHSRTRAVQIGTHVAIAPGAVITIEGSPIGIGDVAWRDAGEMTHGAAAVTTRFARPVTVLAVALASTDDARFDRLELDLGGASVAHDRKGRERDPIVVHLGGTAVLVYEVDPAGTTTPTIARVRAGTNWTVVGVLGGSGDAATLAQRLATRGVAAVAAKALATAGAGATFIWRRGKTVIDPNLPRTSKKRTSAAASKQPMAAVAPEEGGRNRGRR
jgi:hypothetical protein